MVLHSDNGGYTKSLGPCSDFDPIKGRTCMTGEAGANNCKKTRKSNLHHFMKIYRACPY